MDIIQIAHDRYTTKNFDPDKKISNADFDKIKDLLRMSPSSTNLQPWHFIITNTEEGKKRMSKGTENFYSFNKAKILNASVVVLFCSRIKIDENYLQLISKTEEKDGRYPNEEVKNNINKSRKMFCDIHKNDFKDESQWLEKQTYINLGFFLLGVAALGLDACPMEGIDTNILNKEFGLIEKGYNAFAAVSIGFHMKDDFNLPTTTPKSRLAEEDIITII